MESVDGSVDRCTTSPVTAELENSMETVSLQEPGDLQLDDQQCLSTTSADVIAASVLLSRHDTVSIEEELIVAPSIIILQSNDQPLPPSVAELDFTVDVDRSPSTFADHVGPETFHVDHDFRELVSTDSRELQPPTSSVSVEIITDDQDVDVPVMPMNELQPQPSDVYTGGPAVASTNSLSKLFADDKHGTDKLGKAFFDVLAQTITPQSSSNAVGPLADVDSNLMCRSSAGDSAYSGGEHPMDARCCHDEDADTRICSVWIPGAKTAQTLLKMASAPPATYFPEKEDLTMPGVIMTEEMKDPIRDLARQYLGEDAATQRITLTADSISQDEEGLVKLICRVFDYCFAQNVGCYRAAVNLTTRLLSSHGQGLKKAGHPSKNSSRSLQIWLVRLSLLLKLRLFNMAEAESEPFHGLDTPDLYYEFHPEVYGSNRRGSMVPFALRTLLPQILSCVGKFGEALDRLYVVLDTVTKIEENLLKGLNENGNEDDRPATTRQASLTVWRKRHIKVLYTITNCLVAQNDFYSAYSLLDTILEKSPDSEANIRSAQGHVLLQLGDIKSAQVSFNLAASARKGGVDAIHETVATSIDRALMFIAHNNFAEALSALTEAHSLDANNPTVINNMAVCLLYMGRLRDSFQLLESAISATPKPFLHECVIVNVCTLYDLESSRSLQKKSAMLEVISRHAGDGFNVFCLKLQSMT